uniref:Uncharacterized protein n=1 Tax=Oryza glumipatula TaxID=40148 RepID=A0A0D9Z7Y0_9ORYZ
MGREEDGNAFIVVEIWFFQGTGGPAPFKGVSGKSPAWYFRIGNIDAYGCRILHGATYKTIISCIQSLQEYGKTKLWLKCAWTYFGERAKENFCRIMAITNFASNIAKF